MVAFGEYAEDGTASAIKARDYKDATDLVATLDEGQTPVISFHPTQDPISGVDVCHSIGANDNATAAVMQPIGFTRCDHGGDAVIDGTPTMRCGSNYSAHLAVAIQGNLIGRDAGGPHGVGASTDGVMYTLTKADVHGVAQSIPFDTTQLTSPHNYSNPQPGDPCHPLAAGAHVPAVASSLQVRRLTPVECERLQGFPDGYTAVPWRKKPAAECPDGPRYKALGNSWAVPVVRWIGKRIEESNGTYS